VDPRGSWNERLSLRTRPEPQTAPATSAARLLEADLCTLPPPVTRSVGGVTQHEGGRVPEASGLHTAALGAPSRCSAPSKSDVSSLAVSSGEACCSCRRGDTFPRGTTGFVETSLRSDPFPFGELGGALGCGERCMPA
jgi:hypothetical protein